MENDATTRPAEGAANATPGGGPSANARTILITGGARGIGRGCVAYFLDRGWNVAAMDVLDIPAQDRLLAVRGDVAVEADCARAVAQTLDRFGRLDALINNAGIASPPRRPPEALPLEAWNRVIAVNLTGVFLMSRHAAPALRAAQGAIVNIASTRALMSEAHTEAYAASKGGVVALTHALAVSLGPALRVNCISPGWIETDPAAQHNAADRAQHPAGRVGTPDDVAAAADYLVGATFVTGQNLVVDGGMMKKMIYV